MQEHKLPAPLYVHLCFQAVHEPYDAPPPGFRGPGSSFDPGAPMDTRGTTAAAAGSSCAGSEGWYADTRFSCPAPPARAAAATAAACCSACEAAASTCSHWTFEGNNCTMWSGRNCKQLRAAGAVSAAPRHPKPGPKPGPAPDAGMPVYHQMLWDAGACPSLSPPPPSAAVHCRLPPGPARPSQSQNLLEPSADLYVGRVVDALKARGMWENLLIIYSAE